MKQRIVISAAMLVAASVLAPVAHAADKVNVRMSWTWWSGNAPFFVALDKGFYKEVNIEPVITQGQGSKTSALTVGQDADQFAENNVSTTAFSISAGVPVKAVANYWQRGPVGITCGAQANVSKPADLKGKSIASTPTGSDYPLLLPFLASNGMSINDIKVVALGDMKLSALVSGQVDCISGDVFYWQPKAEDQGKKTTSMLFADYGVTNLSYGLITSDDMIAKNPELVRRFVAATLKGLEYAFAHKDEAADIVRKNTNEIDPKKQIIGVLDYWEKQLHTKNTEGKPLGWMAAEDWEAMNATLEKYGEMKGRKAASAYFTNDFLPKK